MGVTIHRGHCFCGDLRYRVTGRPMSMAYCHCESCRRASAAPSVTWGTFAVEGFAILSGRCRIYASSSKVRRGFCERCGSQITYAHADSPATIDITLATLDEPEALAPERHVWVEDKLCWVVIGDELPQFRRLTVRESPESA